MVCGKSLAGKLVVCDPVHRRYIMLPAIPIDLRVICLAQCRMNLLLLIFSSLNGQWHVLTYDQWGASATLASFVKSDPRLSSRQFVRGCFYWHLQLKNKLLVLDLCAMEFSTVNLQSEQKKELGMLNIGNGYDKDIVDRRFWLAYSILTNNQWHVEKVIPLPLKDVHLVGAAGGYLLMYTVYLKSSRDQLEFRYFSVDLKTFQVELFTALCKHLPGRLYADFPNPPGRLYAGFPPSLLAPTI
ncbi:hypothetical protein VPH35_134910 [Triticum aestivum]